METGALVLIGPTASDKDIPDKDSFVARQVCERKNYFSPPWDADTQKRIGPKESVYEHPLPNSFVVLSLESVRGMDCDNQNGLVLTQPHFYDGNDPTAAQEALAICVEVEEVEDEHGHELLYTIKWASRAEFVKYGNNSVWKRNPRHHKWPDCIDKTARSLLQKDDRKGQARKRKRKVRLCISSFYLLMLSILWLSYPILIESADEISTRTICTYISI